MSRHTKLIAILCLLAAGVSAPAGARAASAKGNFTVAPVPAWVEPVDVPDAGADAAADARDGVLDLLEDSQVRVTASASERCFRHVAKVISQAGLEEVSQLELDFDPTSEALVIHYIRIRRGSQTIDALKPSDVSVIQPERELDQQIYNGTLSALVFLHDVRPGDVVDYAYSLVGRGDGLGNRFADTLALGETYPVRKLRWRILWPEGRPLWYRTQNADVEPVTRQLNGSTEYVWTRDNVPAVETDHDAPLWYDPTPEVQVSEFETWGDVARWAEPFYEPAAKLPADLERQIATWSAQFSQPQDRLVAAARFVQDEIRYTGIELGPSSYKPAEPATVYARRFGDCKDKSMLLASILRRMNIEAYPALVNMDRGRVVRDWQPSPFAFDHCIVRATIGGQHFWVDSTMQLQRGDLARRRNPDYGSALVIGEGANDLEEISSGAGATSTVVREVYTLDGDRAGLEVTSVYTGDDADDMRYTLARRPVSDITRDGLNYYGGDFSTVEPDGQPEVQDDQEANTIRVVERYRISGFWEGSTRTMSAARVEDLLPNARGTRRTGPLAIEYPVDVRQTIEIRLPGRAIIKEESGAVEDDAVRFAYKYSTSGNSILLDFHYQALRDSIPAARVAQHRDAVKRIRKLVDYTLRRETIGAATVPLGPALLAALGIALCLIIPLALLLGRRAAPPREDTVRPAAPARPEPKPGEAPATAFELHGEGDRLGHLESLRCSCGGAYELADGRSEEHFHYDGRYITVLGLRCVACGAGRDVYFAPAGARAASVGD